MNRQPKEGARNLLVECIAVGDFGNRALHDISVGLVADDPDCFRAHASPRPPEWLVSQRADLCFVVGDGRDPRAADIMLQAAVATRCEGALTFMVSSPDSSALWTDMGTSDACLLEVDDPAQAARAVLAPTNSLLCRGIVGTDFVDFRETFGGRCRGVSVHTVSSGPRRADDAARHCLWLAKERMDLGVGSLRAAYLITGGSAMQIAEANIVAAVVEGEIHPEAAVIWSMCFDERVAGLGVTLLAVADD